MASCIKLNSLSTKQLTIICSLIATVITIGVVITITIRNGSSSLQESNIQKYAFKIKSNEPQWIKFVDEDKSLVNAFIAGTIYGSELIYVCRVNRTDAKQILPGTYNPLQSSCIVSYGSLAHKYHEFEILIAEDNSIFVWKDSNDDNASNGALIGGISESNYDIKIAKVEGSDGELHIGRLDWNRKEAMVPVGQYEHGFRYHKVLCLNDYSLI